MTLPVDHFKKSLEAAYTLVYNGLMQRLPMEDAYDTNGDYPAYDRYFAERAKAQAEAWKQHHRDVEAGHDDPLTAQEFIDAWVADNPLLDPWEFAAQEAEDHYADLADRRRKPY